MWKSIFGLTKKKVETVNIDNKYNSGERSSLLSPQGSRCPIHVDTLDTPKENQSRLKNEDEDGEKGNK